MTRRSISAGLVFCISIVLILGIAAPLPSFGTCMKEVSQDSESSAGRLKSHFRELRRSLQDIPKDTFDSREVVKMIGKDPERLFEWVRDETYLVPYTGMLRGPVGVLMDRSGNSLDRALLLQELLRKAGHKARLANGTLTEADAAGLYQFVLNIPDESNTAHEYNSPSELNRRIQGEAARYGLDPEQLLKDLEAPVREQERIRVDLMRRVDEQSSDIYRHIKRHIQIDGDGSKQEKIKILQDHWWVQWQQEDDWVDLDPSFPQAHPGWSPTLATLRVVIERWENGKTTEEKVLERTFYPSDAKEEHILFYQRPVNWPDLKEMSKSNDPTQAFRQAVMDQNEWLPILQIKSRTVKKASIKDDGTLNSSPGKKRSSKSKSITGGLMGGLGGGSQKAESGNSIFTAEWLEYEIFSPGAPLKSIRRSVFDLIGPASRRSQSIEIESLTDEMKFQRNLALLNQTEVLIMACRWSAPYVESRLLEKTLDLKKDLTALAKNRRGTSSEDVLSLLDKMSPLASILESVALSRNDLSLHAREAYVDRPNIFSMQTFLAEDEEEIHRVQAIDIINNGMSALPIPGKDAFSVLLHQGVADTNAELKPLIQENRVSNTSEVHESSKEQKIEWKVLVSSGDLAALKGRIEPDVSALIDKDLSDGYLILLPEKAVEINGRAVLAWWRIDSKTGNVLGMGETGMGQSMTGYAERANVILQMQSSIQLFADIMRCMATAISSPLRGNRPQTDEATRECVWNIACGAINKLAGNLVKDVNWPNIIIKHTISEAWGGLCKGLAEKIL